MNEKIAVYGLGKLGLPLATVFARGAFETIGIDPNVTHDNVHTNEPGVVWEDL